jgi:hypothetical protein
MPAERFIYALADWTVKPPHGAVIAWRLLRWSVYGLDSKFAEVNEALNLPGLRAPPSTRKRRYREPRA